MIKKSNPSNQRGSMIIMAMVVGGCGLTQFVWPSDPGCSSCNVERMLKTQAGVGRCVLDDDLREQSSSTEIPPKLDQDR